MIIYIDKKDLINSINNCEHLSKDKLKYKENDENEAKKDL